MRITDLSGDFSSAVMEELGSVLSAEGLHVAHTTGSSVTFKSSDVEIQVSQNPMSYEIELDARWIMYPEEGYSLSELLRMGGHAEAADYRNFVAPTIDARTHGLKKLRQLLVEVFQSGYCLDETARLALHRQREFLAQKMEDEVSNEQARRCAAKAWEQRAFSEFIVALRRIRGPLTSAEDRQLKYAEKRLKE